MSRRFYNRPPSKRRKLFGYSFRSSWEANYALYLEWLKENQQIKGWKYEDKEFEFPVKRGNRFYKCDFHIFENDGRESFHEIKGYMDRDSAVKLNRMKKYFPEVNLILIDAKQYQALTKQMKPILEEWQ